MGLLRVFTPQEHSGKITALMLADFSVTVTQFLKLLGASITSVKVRKFKLD